MVGSSYGVAGLVGIFYRFRLLSAGAQPCRGPCQSCPAGDNQTGNKPVAIAGVLRLKTMARPGPPSGSALADSPVEGTGFELSVPRARSPLSLSLFGGFGPEVSRLCLCDSLPARSVRSQFRRDRRCYTEGAPLR